MDQKPEKTVRLDGLLGHLSASSGLYSRETFLNLIGSIVRLVRQYHLKGLVFERFLGDTDFQTLAMTLKQQHDIRVFEVDDTMMARDTDKILDHGMLVVLTNQFCATVYWSTASQDAYGMYEGGWIFHPGDSKTVALQLAQLMDDPVSMAHLIEETPLDRRYDEKTTGFITQLVNNLEHRNRELTLALNQVKELNAKIVDHERLAAIGQLCSVIAHEIRNPLGLIDLYAKLIEHQVETLDPCDQKEGLEKNLRLIRNAACNLEGILSELTSYARPLELELQTIDLRVVVSDIIDMFEPKYQEKGMQLVWNPPAKPIQMNIDIRRIQQALINLVKNALEASKPESTVEVVLAIRKDDDKILIQVQDQGSGVDEKIRQKLFTPYFSTKGNGTGLGLAHSQKILQAHGGSVALLSSASTGSTFALVLPKTGASPPKKTNRSMEEQPC